MARMRTIDGAYEEMHASDPGSAVSKKYIRRLVTAGEIPSRMAGRKYLLNYDALVEYLEQGKASSGTKGDINVF